MTAPVDLNYRINLPDSDIRTLLSEDTEDNIPILLQYDQVQRQKNL